jgi:hypothetical protein
MNARGMVVKRKTVRREGEAIRVDHAPVRLAIITRRPSVQWTWSARDAALTPALSVSSPMHRSIAAV